MKRDFLVLEDVELKGKKVLVRVDINSSINPGTGEILDDTRIRRHAKKTIEYLSNEKAKIVIIAHQSRPGNLDFVSLEKHAERMGEIIGKEIKFVPDICGSKAKKNIKKLKNSEILMLDNLRFHKDEIDVRDYNGENFEPQENTEMIKELAPEFDLFVNDAFATAHRCQPSIVGFSRTMPTIAGKVMENEIEQLNKAVKGKETPSLLILGGNKAEDSVKIATNFLENGIDKILTGGVVANIFLTASGINIGNSSKEYIKMKIKNHEEIIERAKELIEKYPNKIDIPNDIALNCGGFRKGIFCEQFESKVFIETLSDKCPVNDIGIETVVRYITEINKAEKIIANGPMGVFEEREFSGGTREIFSAIAESKAFTVVGGGETAAAFNVYGLTERVDHISTGGGACISYLAGKFMPAIEAMKRNKDKFSK